ncbi:TatD family hydrolase [Saccharibacillus sp. JS10]|uniref:TatD family hydrolase n=1 Tax=Saccharibacillus sp. JS10 TaxID=2950552 RepID=UPI0021091C44|nr:TatD family hydrolase [Saccharibacillus sp. JS10]MCQ4087487.1 TatD family hydrolase [Saccharibacillus sp. JS10]
MTAHRFPLADTHIHLEQYTDEQISQMLAEFQEGNGAFVVAVSMNLESSKRTEKLAKQYPDLIHPAYGFHPEQPLPSIKEENALFEWMQQQAQAGQMTAVGEVGLPYYSRLEAIERGDRLDEDGYLRLLERFIVFAAKHDLPIILHAVYEDAPIACELLERHGIRRAHFHWFKGDEHTVNRMITNGYMISFTPDLAYENEIQELALRYPASLVMSETDGPWQFEHAFANRMTHPSMTADVCREWASLRGVSEDEARRQLFENAERFYGR